MSARRTTLRFTFVILLLALEPVLLPAFAWANSSPLISEPSEWKLPLPAGDWQISQGPKTTLNCAASWSSHCTGSWNMCAIDIVKTLGEQSTTKGQPVLAAADGKIVFARYDTSGGGNVIMIEHGDNGRTSAYLHLDSPIYVEQTYTAYIKNHNNNLPVVKQGDVIGYIGWGGNQQTGGYHLHFNVFTDRTHSSCINPNGIDGNTDLAWHDANVKAVFIKSSNQQGGASNPPVSKPITPQPPVNPPASSNKPSPPALASPGNNERLAATTEITFQWNTAANATQYYLEYSGAPYGTLNSGWTNNTSHRIGTMWAGTYSWKVKARNASGESDWSETRTFTIQQGPSDTPTRTPTLTRTLTPQPQAPASPSLRDPANNAAFAQSTDVWFAWNYVDGAKEFYLEYSGGPYGTLNSGWINDTAFHIGTMWPGTYSWKVKARNDKGLESNWSETRTFKIEGPTNTPTVTPSRTPTPQGLAAPTLRDPSSNATLSQSTEITFAWNSVSNATQYYLEYSGVPYGTLNSGWIGGTSQRIGQMWPGTYSWKVKARNNNVESAWSETRTFTIQDTPTPTFTPSRTATAPPPAFTGNVAPRANRSPDGINSGNAFDGSTSTFWTNGLGHRFTLTLTWADSLPVTRIIVWDRPQNSPDNNQINALIITLGNGASKRFGMDSGGRRCIDVSLSPPQTMRSVTLKADDASGNNGLGEVEIWIGGKSGGPSCSNSGSMP